VEHDQLLIRVPERPRRVLRLVKSADEKSVVDLKSDFDGQGQEGDFVVSFGFVQARR
jgi:hypothetical protein